MKVLAASALGLLVLAGCSDPKSAAYQGYVEGEYVLVAAPYGGQLITLNVARGQTVETGVPLFTLEQGNEVAGRQEAEQRMRAAQARFENLRTGQRMPEREALLAEASQAAAALELSTSELKRTQELYDKGFVSAARLDEARAAYARDRARVEQTKAQVRVAEQSVGRSAEREAAQSEMHAARAVVAQADWKLGQKEQAAPRSGLVQDTFFVPGEWVPAGKPVVSLLPPENIKLRFFVPEALVATLRKGQKVSATCDGCSGKIAATVSYVSPNAEFTPPVIYSREARSKLVFLVEARVAAADAVRLHPGQPVDVEL